MRQGAFSRRARSLATNFIARECASPQRVFHFIGALSYEMKKHPSLTISQGRVRISSAVPPCFTGKISLCSLQDTNISLATYVCVTSQNTRHPVLYAFPCALSGPFDALRCAGLSAPPALCNCTIHRYLRVNGLVY